MHGAFRHIRTFVSFVLTHCVLLLAIDSIDPVHAAETTDAISFNKHIRPILSANCFACHGFDAKKREAELRLDTPDGAFAERNGSRAIVPGNIEASELWRRIVTDNSDEQMPPLDSHKELTDEQKQLLRRWIEQGAPYQKHWAFEPPNGEMPREVVVGPRHQNPIDDFIAARLVAEGLTPAPEADRHILLRRASFALTGLPPTLDEQQEFLSDQREGAYERLVDRLLESPRFGEEMARHWLDVARYADTHGMHLDNERQTWAYRDWVVGAFNRNLPFDQFTIDQLAGDLLPDATPEQLTATGYNRCNVTSSEGGSIDDELIFRYAVDRTATTIQTWLGLTAGCAVCHDHKFDPITQREFYSLYAFFHSAADPAMDGNSLLTPPVVRLEPPTVTAQLRQLDQQIADRQQAIDQLTANLNYSDPQNDPQQSFSVWWQQATGKDTDGLPGDINAIAKGGPGSSVSAEDTNKLRTWYLQNICAATQPQFAPLLTELKQLRDQRSQVDASVPSTFIFRDLDQPRQSFVMMRGAYDKPGDRVEPGVPAILPPLTTSTPSNRATRLDLARWLVAHENPLTARVTVNRFWQQVFGVGLVKTSYDFGSQGQLPSHPELLDWLAVDFRESGWNVKRLMRMLVTSEAFRRHSQVDPAVYARDPENRLYARGPRIRLDAEQIRDNALFVGGLIDLTMGGKGVRTYQPNNIWEPVGFAGSNTRFYQQDNGSSLYRRSLYTFLKRTAPPPFMSNFDAPNREQFCTRRERSNTPLQALQLMNDVQHVEAARHLAQRMITAGGAEPADRIGYGFRLALARQPEPDELAVLNHQLQLHRDRYQPDVEAARKLISLGESKPDAKLDPVELAAYTMIANTILNLDETLTRN